MCTRVNRRVAWVASLVVMSSLVTVTALAEEDAYADAKSDQDSRPGEKRWVPSIAFVGAFHGQRQDSSLSSSCDIGGPGGENGGLAACTQSGPLGRDGPPTPATSPTPLRDAAEGDEFGFWPGVGIDFQLMTPQFIELPYNVRPRPFVGAEIMAVFPPSRATANEGSLKGLSFPENVRDLDAFPTQAINGGGSETTSKPDTFQYGAQVGVAFPFEALDRTIRIKPSFGWLRYTLEIEGRILTPIKDDVNGDQDDRTYGPNVRVIDIGRKLSENIDAIGPGIEVELESGQFGPIAAAVFASANGYKVLGDRKFKFKKNKSFPDGTGPGGDGLLADTYRARWEHEIAPWVFRFKFGVRFHFVGD